MTQDALFDLMIKHKYKDELTGKEVWRQALHRPGEGGEIPGLFVSSKGQHRYQSPTTKEQALLPTKKTDFDIELFHAYAGRRCFMPLGAILIVTFHEWFEFKYKKYKVPILGINLQMSFQSGALDHNVTFELIDPEAGYTIYNIRPTILTHVESKLLSFKQQSLIQKFQRFVLQDPIYKDSIDNFRLTPMHKAFIGKFEQGFPTRTLRQLWDIKTHTIHACRPGNPEAFNKVNTSCRSKCRQEFLDWLDAQRDFKADML